MFYFLSAREEITSKQSTPPPLRIRVFWACWREDDTDYDILRKYSILPHTWSRKEYTHKTSSILVSVDPAFCGHADMLERMTPSTIHIIYIYIYHTICREENMSKMSCFFPSSSPKHFVSKGDNSKRRKKSTPDSNTSSQLCFALQQTKSSEKKWGSQDGHN